MQEMRLLIIESSTRTREEIGRELRKFLPEDAQLETAEDPEDGMEKLRLFVPNLILLNVIMASVRVHGESFLHQLSGTYGISVFVLGRLISQGHAVMADGAGGYLMYPNSPSGTESFYKRLADALVTLHEKKGAERMETLPQSVEPPRLNLPAEHEKKQVQEKAKTIENTNILRASAPSVQIRTPLRTIPVKKEVPQKEVAGQRKLVEEPFRVERNDLSVQIKAPRVEKSVQEKAVALTEAALRAIAGGKPAMQKNFSPTRGEMNTVAANAQRARGGMPPKPEPEPYSVAKTGLELIAIGASTGGTEALSKVFRALRAPLPPIVVVQHIPPVFSKLFATRLEKECHLHAKEGADGDILRSGTIYIAPGGKHMRVVKAGGVLRLSCQEGPRVHGCIPAVDPLFESVLAAVGGRAVGVILTGMGRDGCAGLLALREAGAHTLGQDEASSIVYGMPKAAFEAGAVEKQLPLQEIASAIHAICRG